MAKQVKDEYDDLPKSYDVMKGIKPLQERMAEDEKQTIKDSIDPDIEEVLTKTGKLLKVIKKHRAIK